MPPPLPSNTVYLYSNHSCLPAHVRLRNLVRHGPCRHPPAPLARLATRARQPSGPGNRPSRPVPPPARRRLAPGQSDRTAAGTTRSGRNAAAPARPAATARPAQHRAAASASRALRASLAGASFSRQPVAVDRSQSGCRCPVGRRTHPAARQLRRPAVLVRPATGQCPASAAPCGAGGRHRLLHVPPCRCRARLVAVAATPAAAARGRPSQRDHPEAPRPPSRNAAAAAARAAGARLRQRPAFLRASPCVCGSAST